MSVVETRTKILSELVQHKVSGPSSPSPATSKSATGNCCKLPLPALIADNWRAHRDDTVHVGVHVRFTPKSGQWSRGHERRGQELFVVGGVEHPERGVPAASAVEVHPVINCSNQFSNVGESVTVGVLVLDHGYRLSAPALLQHMPVAPLECSSPYHSYVCFMISAVYWANQQVVATPTRLRRWMKVHREAETGSGVSRADRFTRASDNSVEARPGSLLDRDRRWSENR